jgi:ABC-type uncharacterized transport system involved in gliding motility auxiliary subunit
MSKGLSGIHFGVHLALMFLLWAMVVYLSQRTFQREDWSRQNLTALSPKTLAVLESIDEPLRVILLVTPDAKGASLLEDVAQEFAAHQPLIRVEKVDPNRDVSRTQELTTQYEVAEANQIIAEYQGRHRIVPLAEMRILESDDVRELGQEPRMVGFQGEAVMSSALMALTRIENPVVYFLAGHGEKDIDNFERSPQAYSQLRERLEADQFDVRVLDLERMGGVPEDTDALVIAGATSRISQPELDLLRSYMNEKGRLAVLADAETDVGLTPLLAEFGVQLSPDVVVDPTRTLQGADVHVTSYSSHPITASLDGIRSIFVRPRSVLPAVRNAGTDADRPRFSPLAASSAQGWAEVEPGREPIQYNPGQDQAGPIPIAAAVEWNGPGAGGGRRLVVFGDSVFAGNWLSNGGGMRLLQNAIAWLVEEKALLEIPPRDVTEIRLQLTRPELNRLLLQAAVLLPGISVIIGLLVGWRRRA